MTGSETQNVLQIFLYQDIYNSNLAKQAIYQDTGYISGSLMLWGALQQ